MSFLPGYLHLSTVGEVFNNARTNRNLLAARAAGLLHPSVHLTAVGDCDCAAYDLYPDATDVPAENPWDDASDEAAEFLGPFVMEQIGMDGTHNKRDVQPRSAFPYGMNLSPLKPQQRIMEFSVMMFATTACGLDFGYDWLERTLLSHGCSTCTPATAWMRSCCPPDDDPSAHLWQFRNFGLAEGPHWEDAPTEGTKGYVRELTLTFFAGDPCRWGTGSMCMFAEAVTTTPVCCDFTAHGRYASVPTIEFDVNADADPDATIGTTITVEFWDANLIDNDCADAGGDPTLSIQIVDTLPQDAVLLLDWTTRRVAVSIDGGVTYIDGSPYINATAGYIDWDGFACRNDDDELAIVIYTAGAPDLGIAASINTYVRAGC